MMQDAEGQGKPFDIAAISGVDYDYATLTSDPYGFGASQELVLTWTNGYAILSAPRWDRASWEQRLTLAQAALAIFACIPNAETSTLRWLFSGKDVERAEAGDVLLRWEEDGAPPVMNLIEFLVEDRAGQRCIRTVGMSALVGYEVEAMIGEDHAELARMVGRLSQDILHTGPVIRDSIIGPDGGKYSLKRLPRNGSIQASIRLLPENT